MAWKQRGNRRYLYKSVREGNRFRSIYLGTGEVAELAAKKIEAQKKILQTEKCRLQSLEITLKSSQKWEHYASLLATASLLLAGYYQHHGSEWRYRNVA